MTRAVRRLVTITVFGAGLIWLATGFADTPSAENPQRLAGPDPARAVEEVFQDPAFWWKRIEPREVSLSWPEKVFRAIIRFLGWLIEAFWDLLASLFRNLFGVFTGDWSVGNSIVWLAVLAILAWSLWKLAPIVARWLASGGRAADPRQMVDWQTLAEADVLSEQAARALRAGQYAEAIRFALLALIASLQQRGLLRFDPARTNREYQSELRHVPELAAPFGQLALIYERVWYGRLPARPDDAERAIRLSGSLIDTKRTEP